MNVLICTHFFTYSIIIKYDSCEIELKERFLIVSIYFRNNLHLNLFYCEVFLGCLNESETILTRVDFVCRRGVGTRLPDLLQILGVYH